MGPLGTAHRRWGQAHRHGRRAAAAAAGRPVRPSQPAVQGPRPVGVCSRPRPGAGPVGTAVGLALGATSVAGAMQLMQQSVGVPGPLASPVTAWRALDELDAPALAKLT